MSFTLSHSFGLPEEVRDSLTQYVEQINQKCSTDLCGLVLFGSVARGDYIMGRSNLNLLLIIRTQTLDILQQLGKLQRQWGKHQIIAPLLMTEEDLGQSARLFPLEFLQIHQHHVLLSGQDVLGSIPIDRSALGWQCEQELMANFIRLRQRFMEGEGRVEAIQALLILSITAVLPCIRGVLYLLGHPSHEKDVDTLEQLPNTLQFDSSAFLDVLRMKKGFSSPGSKEWIKLYDRYLEQLNHFGKRVGEIRQKSGL